MLSSSLGLSAELQLHMRLADILAVFPGIYEGWPLQSPQPGDDKRMTVKA